MDSTGCDFGWGTSSELVDCPISLHFCSAITLKLIFEFQVSEDKLHRELNM